MPDAQHEGTEAAEVAQLWGFGGKRAGGRTNGRMAAEAGVAEVVAVCAGEVGMMA